MIRLSFEFVKLYTISLNIFITLVVPRDYQASLVYFDSQNFPYLEMKTRIGGEQYDCDGFCDPFNRMDPGRNEAVHGDFYAVKLRFWDELTSGMWTDSRLF